MSCEGGSNRFDIDEGVSPADLSELQTLMHTFHAVRGMAPNEAGALERKNQVVHSLLKYLSFVPIGKSSQLTERINPSVRERIFHERGCVCEICQVRIEDDNFELHHMNYFQGNDPGYLKVACIPCHATVCMLTGFVDWFNQRTQPTAAEITEESKEEEQTAKIPAYLTLFGRGK